MRAGVAVAVIRQASAQLGGELSQAAEALLTTVRKEVNNEEPSATLLARIDQALSVAWKTPRAASPSLTRGLVGLRLALFDNRTEERSVGTECVSTCKLLCSTYHYNNTIVQSTAIRLNLHNKK